MFKRLNCVLPLFFGLVFAASCHNAAAQNKGDQQKQLEAITATADRICNVVTMEGSTESAKVSGEVKAELSGLAKRLASLGLSGTGAIDSSEYHGLLQQDLALALKDNASCKIHVFDKLIDRLLPPQERKSSENLNPEIRIKPDDGKRILLVNKEGKAYNVDVTSDAKIHISRECLLSPVDTRQDMVFSVTSIPFELPSSRTEQGEDLVGSLPTWQIPKTLTRISTKLADREEKERRESNSFYSSFYSQSLLLSYEAQLGMRIMVEYEDSNHNRLQRYFGIQCNGSFDPSHPQMCVTSEFGPKAYEAFYRERGFVGSVGEAVSFGSLLQESSVRWTMPYPLASPC